MSSKSNVTENQKPLGKFTDDVEHEFSPVSIS